MYSFDMIQLIDLINKFQTAPKRKINCAIKKQKSDSAIS